MKSKKPEKKNLNRREFLRLTGLAGVGAAMAACAQATTEPTEAPKAEPTVAEVVEAPMPLKGTKIKTLMHDDTHMNFIADHIPEFTALTGIEVEPTIVAWPVLLDQEEVELSSGSSNYDVMWMIFIKAQRWSRAGWTTPLDDLVAASNYDIDDFLPATVEAMGLNGVLHGIPFFAESTQMIYRSDVLSEAGLAVPQTFTELETVLEAIHNPPDFSGWVVRTEPNSIHFPFPIWLQGFGGNVFRDPPNDLTPAFTTPEALAAAQNYTDLIVKYNEGGAQSYGVADCQTALQQGKAGIWADALGMMPPIQNPETSTVADKVEITLVPGGPAGRFPQIATHGYQIPNASENKEAAWEFIQWATSKEMMMRVALEVGFSALPRKSILTADEYGAKFNKGETKVGELIAEAINLAKPAYRVVPEFPEIGARMGQALAEIYSGQEFVEDAMGSLQRDAEQIMIAGGNEISP